MGEREISSKVAWLEYDLDFEVGHDARPVDVKMLYSAAYGKKHSAASRVEETGCVLCNVPKTTRGYCRMNYPKGELEGYKGKGASRIDGHRIACLCKYGFEAFRIKSDLGYECSHLCHTKSCIKPGHLILEDNHSNTRRNACASAGICMRSHIHPGAVDCVMKANRVDQVKFLFPDVYDEIQGELSLVKKVI